MWVSRPWGRQDRDNSIPVSICATSDTQSFPLYYNYSVALRIITLSLAYVKERKRKEKKRKERKEKKEKKERKKKS
jgi:hypothetical protein